MHMAHLKAIINQAIRDKKVSYDTHPFEYYERPAGMPKERDISVADVKKIRDAEIKKEVSACCQGCVHAFVLSRRYQSDGLDAILIYKDDVKLWNMYVKNTKNTKKGDMKISFTIPEEAKPIIQKMDGA